MKPDLPDVGKVSPDVFDDVILTQLGRKRPEVLVGPQNGVDIGVTDLGGGQVMVTTTDPVFVVPAYGWARAAWFAVHILASDAATSGLAPDYLTIDLNLPLSMDRESLETLWTAIHTECDKLGMAVISGHTGRYHGCDFPMIGGATVMCIGSRDRYVTPRMARPGDHVIVTKGAAIEAAGLFAVTFPDRLAAAHGSEFAADAADIFWQMSVVKDALTAVQAGVRDDGITAMHDATECGVYGGVYELARASDVGLIIEKDAIPLDSRIDKICRLFEIDPYVSISEGTLIATCRPHKSDEVLQRLADAGISSSRIGEVVEDSARLSVVESGRETPLVHPRVDPFWNAFALAAQGAGA